MVGWWACCWVEVCVQGCGWMYSGLQVGPGPDAGMWMSQWGGGRSAPLLCIMGSCAWQLGLLEVCTLAVARWKRASVLVTHGGYRLSYLGIPVTVNIIRCDAGTRAGRWVGRHRGGYMARAPWVPRRVAWFCMVLCGEGQASGRCDGVMVCRRGGAASLRRRI